MGTALDRFFIRNPMTKLLPLLPLAALVAAVLVASSAERPLNRLGADEIRQGYALLFDGKTLEGWDGDQRLWRVEDGAIVGSSDGHTIEQNTFLILDRPFSDFVLRLELKLRNGNSGIQFRSKVFADWVVKGYQADASDAGDRSAWGNFYEEKGRGRNVMSTPTEGWLKGKTVVRVGDWNDYEIYAKGNRIRLTLNGLVTINMRDSQASDGVIAIQLHSGKPMEVRLRNIRIKEL